jgi:hypothetical protein
MHSLKIYLRPIQASLLLGGLILVNGLSYAQEIDQSSNTETSAIAAEDTQQQQEKIKARLKELAEEDRLAKLAANGHYIERRSYGTQKETDPPRYVKQANKTWLNEYDAFSDVNWLDLGLEYRARFEHRDNDFRRNIFRNNEQTRKGSAENIDEPLLLRTRAYIGVKNIFDPLRFALELQDSRRNHGDYSREYDTRDVNQADILQGYLELNFKDSFLGKDDLGNSRPIWVRAGRHAWEAIDRRLIARNEWRNTTNNFQGVRANIGDKKNDWQLELLAVKPIQRFTTRSDEVDHAQDFYGAIGNWRGWSEYVTLEPYYLLLKQDGSKVEYDANGIQAKPNAKIDREIHTAGLRAYGVVGKSGFDFDASYVKQWGHQDKLDKNGKFLQELDHDAYAYNAEIGYSFNHPWKPRFSAFYGVASGDDNPNDGKNGRFERLFGFARPWSNDDYIEMANIRTPKLRVEFDPKLSFLDNVKVDTGFSWYRLDSARDQWGPGARLADSSGNSGRDLGKEFDVRVRFPLGQYAALNLGYAYFWAGDFVKDAVKIADNKNDPNRRDNSEFFYTELTLYGF